MQIFLKCDLVTLNIHLISNYIFETKIQMDNQKQTNVQMFEIGSKQQNYYATEEVQNPIGTQILDPSMPSDLNFGKESQFQIEPVQQNIPQSKKHVQIYNPQINIYTIRGEAVLKIEPQYHAGSIIKNSLPTFDVKCYSQQKSQGVKKIWQAIIGYVKRQIYVRDGYIYILELQSEGYFVHTRWDVADLFQIFLDSEDNKIRLVFKDQKRLITKDFKVVQIGPIFEKISQQIGKIGMKLNN